MCVCSLLLVVVLICHLHYSRELPYSVVAFLFPMNHRLNSIFVNNLLSWLTNLFLLDCVHLDSMIFWYMDMDDQIRRLERVVTLNHPSMWKPIVFSQFEPSWNIVPRTIQWPIETETMDPV